MFQLHAIRCFVNLLSTGAGTYIVKEIPWGEGTFDEGFLEIGFKDDGRRFTGCEFG